MDEVITWVLIGFIAVLLLRVSHNTEIKKIELPNLEAFEKIEDTFLDMKNKMFPEQTVVAKIVVAKLCNDEPGELGDCDTGSVSEDNTVYAYWEVVNGVGCCASFNCDYSAFKKACLDDFKLYNIFIDGRQKNHDPDEYTYVCENRLPWNYERFRDVKEGKHTITVQNLNCSDQIVDEINIDFELTKIENDWVIIRYD